MQNFNPVKPPLPANANFEQWRHDEEAFNNILSSSKAEYAVLSKCGEAATWLAKTKTLFGLLKHDIWDDELKIPPTVGNF